MTGFISQSRPCALCWWRDRRTRPDLCLPSASPDPQANPSACFLPGWGTLQVECPCADVWQSIPWSSSYLRINSAVSMILRLSPFAFSQPNESGCPSNTRHELATQSSNKLLPMSQFLLFPILDRDDDSNSMKYCINKVYFNQKYRFPSFSLLF